MKALPLWQPWASLVVMGAKRIETRHWRPPAYLVGQRIAIHATKTEDHLGLCLEHPFSEYLPDPEALPLGALVGTAVLDCCREITPVWAGRLEEENPHEFAFGNYAPGRFAWFLRDVEALAEPVPYSGSQGLFEVPDHLVGHTARQGALL